MTLFNKLYRHHGHNVQIFRCDNDGINAKNGDQAVLKCLTCEKVLLQCEDEIETVTCKFCHEFERLGVAHRHDNGYVCENCWDDRLRTTE